MKNFFIVFSLGVVACAPLFNGGFYTSHDGENHLVRIAHFYNHLTKGDWYPRWIDELNFGLGYPLFTFTYPLPYYIASISMAIDFDPVQSLKNILFLSVIVSGWIYFLWLKKLNLSNVQSILGAGLFIFVPYRFLNLYVRVALGEIAALTLIPVALYLFQTRSKLTALAIAGTILSHPPSAVIFLPIMFLQYGLGMFLSAFFWLPALVLTSHTFFPKLHNFAAQHLLSVSQLIYSPWNFGFSKIWGESDGMSFQLGIANWLVLILGLLGFAKLKKIGKLALVCSLTAIFLVINWPGGQMLWQSLGFIQYPWRLLAVPMMLIPVIGALVIRSRLPAVFILVLAIYANRNHIRINLPEYIDTPANYFLRTDTTTTSTPDELKPLKYDSNTKHLFTNSWSIQLGTAISILGCLALVRSKITV